MAHPDLEALLDAMLPFAQQMIEEHGEFFPFGASMGADGTTALDGADTGDEQPPSQELVALLVGCFRARAEAGEMKGAGICVNARVLPPGEEQKTDAIVVSMDHAEAECVDVFLPYEKGPSGETKYGEIFASPGSTRFFNLHSDGGRS